MNVVVILAGGLGKRMKSNIPKVLHKVHGLPMLIHVINRAKELNADKILVVVGKYIDLIRTYLTDYNVIHNIELVYQEKALGTGHAVLCCREHFKDINSKVLILSGDVPLITTRSLQNMLKSTNNACVMTTIMDEPHGYGRIIDHDGSFIKIVEHKDCSIHELLCKKVNAGIYVINSELLYKYLPKISNNNSQNEYYLTDIMGLLKADNLNIDTYDVPIEQQHELKGINTKYQLDEINSIKFNDFQENSCTSCSIV